MEYFVKKVRAFHLKYGYLAPEKPETLSIKDMKFRANLIKEEIMELHEAWNTNPKKTSHIIKELCDVFYVIAGYYVEHGIEPSTDMSRIIDFSHTNTNADQLLDSVFNSSNSFNREVGLYVNNGSSMRYFITWAEVNIALFATHVIDLETLRKCFDEVHESNMSKGTNGAPVFNLDGKLMKGEDYRKADLSFLDEKTTSGRQMIDNTIQQLPDFDEKAISEMKSVLCTPCKPYTIENAQIRTTGFIVTYPGDSTVGLFKQEWKLSGEFEFDSETDFYAFKMKIQEAFELCSDTPIIVESEEEKTLDP